jgi:DNA-binding transcriptional ArsR family regulator
MSDVARDPMADTDAVLQALAHPARRNIVLILSHLGGELPSGYLAARFQHSWPTTTRHLAVLERAGVVHVRRQGRGGLYRLDRARLQRVLRSWLGHLEAVGPEKTWPHTGPRSTRDLRSTHPQSKGRRHARSTP